MTTKNYIQILITSALWGSSFLMMKIALDELTPFHISFYRIFTGMLFINLINRDRVKLTVEGHIRLSLVGLLWMALPFYLFAKSEETISSSLAGLINGSTPIFISLVAITIFKEKINARQGLYLFSGFVGIYLICFGLNSIFNELNFGALLALLASISYGFAVNIVQPVIKNIGGIKSLKITLRYGSLFSLVLLIINEPLIIPTLESSLLPILLLGIGSSGIAFLSYYNLINDVGAIGASIAVYIVPIFSVIFGFVFLNEYSDLIQLVGIFIVIFSAFQFSKIKS